MLAEYPAISEQEWHDLEAEAGHPLIGLRQAHEFRMRKLLEIALNRLLKEGRNHDANVASNNQPRNLPDPR